MRHRSRLRGCKSAGRSGSLGLNQLGWSAGPHKLRVEAAPDEKDAQQLLTHRLRLKELVARVQTFEVLEDLSRQPPLGTGVGTGVGMGVVLSSCARTSLRSSEFSKKLCHGEASCVERGWLILRSSTFSATRCGSGQCSSSSEEYLRASAAAMSPHEDSGSRRAPRK